MVSGPCSTQGGGTPGTWDGYQGVNTLNNFVDSNFNKNCRKITHLQQYQALIYYFSGFKSTKIIFPPRCFD